MFLLCTIKGSSFDTTEMNRKTTFLVFHHNDWQIFTSKGEKITLTLRIVKKVVSIKSNCFVNNYTYLALGSNLVVNLLVLCV